MITVGTKVAIMPGADYAGRFVGQVGIVKKNYKDKIGVQIDGYINPDSEYGVFWFEERFLAVIPDAGVLADDAIHQIIFSGPKTIIMWKDGTKTIVSCGEGDQYDRYVGFCAAVTKKMFGSTTKIKKTIDQYTKESK
jgi:hypothetical protein